MRYGLARPRFYWGPAFAYVLDVGYPLDDVAAGDEPRDGFETARAPSGVEDAWDTGDDHTLEADLRWIPGVDSATPVATGWDGAKGVRAFLAAGRQKGLIRLIRDARNLLAKGTMGADSNADGVVDGWTTLNPDGFPAVYTFDAVDRAQKIEVTPTWGGGDIVGAHVLASTPIVAAAGGFVTFGTRYRTQDLVTAGAEYYVTFFTQAGAVVAGNGPHYLPASAAYTRSAYTVPIPAGADYATCYAILRVSGPPGAPGSGKVWFKDAVLTYGTADLDLTTDQPAPIDGYLVEPMRGQAERETDGTRRVRFKLRSAIPFDGY